MYHDKCPRCGGELGSVCQWDIVTDQYCYDEENCGWEKSVASVGGFAGEQYAIFHNDYEEDDMDCLEEDDDWFDCDEDRPEFVDFVGDEPEHEGYVEDVDDDNDLPF